MQSQVSQAAARPDQIGHAKTVQAAPMNTRVAMSGITDVVPFHMDVANILVHLDGHYKPDEPVKLNVS